MNRLNSAPIKPKSGQEDKGHLAESSVSVSFPVSFPHRFITREDLYADLEHREVILVCGFVFNHFLCQICSPV